MGMEKGLEALLWTFVLGAALSLVVLVWNVGPLATVSRVVRLIAGKLRLGWFMPLSDEERKALQPPIFLAPSALGGSGYREVRIDNVGVAAGCPSMAGEDPQGRFVTVGLRDHGVMGPFDTTLRAGQWLVQS